jgi:hypothetical protein
MALTAFGTILAPEPTWGLRVFLAGDPDGVRGSQSGRGMASSPVGEDSGTVAGPAFLRVSATAAAMPRASAEPPEGVLLTLLPRTGDWNAESVPAHFKKSLPDCSCGTRENASRRHRTASKVFALHASHLRVAREH